MELGIDQEQAITAREATENVDMNVRCVENNMMGNKTDEEIVKLKNLVIEAKNHIEEAEKDLAAKKEKLKKLQSKLQDEVIKDVKQLKAPVDKTKTDIGRKWRVLGMKVRVGIAPVVKRRNLNDAETFIVKETEEACKEDQLDLEGKCMRKKKDKRHFRRSGVGVGLTQGRDCAW
eukprot:GFUD01060458.1.p1 GENE.GFUD01060458.1~~GFUD01060458.1.p1  ORF type:complete len:175 (+),score=63.23 GFUD01060458.1:135-659(+)